MVISLRKTLFAGYDVTLKQFSPTEIFSSSDSNDLESEFIVRLDGLEVINKVFVKYNYGLMTDLDLLKNNIIVSFFPNSTYGSLKRYNSETTIKVEMLSKYANIQELDYNSSMLTDMFGTMGLLGFILGGIVLGYVTSKIDFILNNYMHFRTRIIFSILFIYSISFSFEMPFWGIFLSPIKFLPFFIGSLLIFKQILVYYKYDKI